MSTCCGETWRSESTRMVPFLTESLGVSFFNDLDWNTSTFLSASSCGFTEVR